MTQVFVNLTPEQAAAIHAAASKQRISFQDAVQRILTRGLDWHLAVDAIQPPPFEQHVGED